MGSELAVVTLERIQKTGSQGTSDELIEGQLKDLP
jgi:hypothetical protein